MARILANEKIDKIIEELNILPEHTQKATILALNRTSEWMKGRLSKDISREKRIKLKLIRDKIKITKADRRNPQTTLDCNFRNISIIELGKVQQNQVGTSVNGVTFPHAFIATLHKGGRRGVYRRTTKKRFPVKSVTIPFFEEATKIINDLLGSEVQEVFTKRFLHEVSRLSGGFV